MGGRERVEEGEMMKWKVMKGERETEVGMKIVQNEVRKEGMNEGRRLRRKDRGKEGRRET